MMIVEKFAYWKTKAIWQPVETGLVFVDYSNLKQSIFSDPSTDLVLSALISRQFDALDVARNLADSGFTGRYRAFAKRLPNPVAVKAEISLVAPNLDFDIFVLDQLILD